MSTEYNPKKEFAISELVTTREAVLLAPTLSRDYVARLVRDGEIAGVRTPAGHWLVHVGSLQNFLHTKQLEESIRAERTRFERRQEQDLLLLPSPIVSPVLSGVTRQSLAVTVAGVFVGVCLFAGQFLLATTGTIWSAFDYGAVVYQSILVSSVTTQSQLHTETSDFQVSGGYVEIAYVNAEGETAVLFQSQMEDEHTDVRVGVSPAEVHIAVAETTSELVSARYTMTGARSVIQPVRE